MSSYTRFHSEIVNLQTIGWIKIGEPSFSGGSTLKSGTTTWARSVLKKVIEENVRDRIREDETWGMKVKKRSWQKYHTIEIIQYLAGSIERKVGLRHPDKIVYVDVVGQRIALSLLKPGEIFPVVVPKKKTHWVSL